MGVPSVIPAAQVSRFLDHLYEAAADADHWPHALRQLAELHRAEGAWMWIQGATAPESFSITPFMAPSVMEAYGAHFHAVNPVWQRTAADPAGTVKTDSMVVPRRAMLATEFYNDWVRPQGVLAALNAVVAVDGGRQSVISVQSVREFDDEDIALYRLLAPHFERAVALSRRLRLLEMGRRHSAELLHRLDEGLVLVDAQAHVLFANGAAERAFARGALRIDDGALSLMRANDTGRLRGLIAGCAGSGFERGSGGRLSATWGSGGEAAIIVAPLRTEAAWTPGPQPVAAVLIADTAATQPPAAAVLKMRFGLTPAEAAVAIELCRGEGLRACADRLGTTRATARTHLARIFDKTGVRRQAALVGVILQALSDSAARDGGR
jgi:DNA-binding CsgD family transcriptional regulator